MIEVQQVPVLRGLRVLPVLVHQGVHLDPPAPRRAAAAAALGADVHVQKAAERRQGQLLGGDKLGAVAELELQLEERPGVDPRLQEVKKDRDGDAPRGGVGQPCGIQVKDYSN